MELESTDVLVFAAHPDDAELSCGGAIAQLTSQGKTVAIVDCTQGELGSRGSVELREIEAQKASAILGVHTRANLQMEDGNIEISKVNIVKIITAIRRFRPKMILFNPPNERHPDHEHVHQLVRAAIFQSGLVKIHTTWNGQPQAPHRPARMFSYMQTYEFQPNFYIDISAVFHQKMDAIRAYSSQVFVRTDHDPHQPQTFISNPAFMEMIEARARYFGSLIGVEYAEAYLSIEPVGIPSLSIWL